MYHIYIFKI